MVSSTCGVPVTVTASWKVTVAVMGSPARKTPFAAVPVPESEKPVTLGTTMSAALPFTVKAESSPRAWVPRASVALLPPASAIVPPFRVSAEAPTLTPSASVSAATTA